MVLEDLTSIDLSDLPMDAFKAHLRLGTGFGEEDIQNEVLESYIRAAIAAIEARIGKVLLSRSLSWELTCWRGGDVQSLPIAPVSEISSVTLVDRAGAETVVEDGTYRLERDAHRPKLVSQGAALPTIPFNGSARVVFVAGYGATWLELPPDLREAVFLLAAHYYENRRDQNGAGGLMPFGVMALLDAYRVVRTLGGV